MGTNARRRHSPIHNSQSIESPFEGLPGGAHEGVQGQDQGVPELKASAGHLRAATVTTPEWTWQTDQNGVFTFVSRHVRDILGFGSEAFVGKNALELMTHGYDPTDGRLLSELWSRHQSFVNIHWVHPHRDGGPIVLESTGIPIDGNGSHPLGYRGITRVLPDRGSAASPHVAHAAAYHNLLENSPDGIFITDANGRFLSVNKIMVKRLRYREMEFLSMTVWDVVPAAYKGLVAGRLSLLLQGNGPDHPLECVVTDKDGRHHWTELRVCRYPLGGDVTGFQAIARDITARKHAEALFRTSEAKLSNALELAHLGYWEYDVESDLFTFNDQFYALFHTSVEQIGSYTMSPDDYARRFLHPDDITMVRGGIDMASRTSEGPYSRTLEHRILYADGGIGYITVRVFVVKDDEGRTIKTYGVNQDITERKQAEAKLAEEHSLLESIVENTPDEVCLKDLQHRFVLANSACVKALGVHSTDDLIGKTDMDILPESVARELVDEEEAIISSGVPMVNRELIQRDPTTGQVTRCLLVTKVPVTDTNGDMTGILTVNRCITDRKRAEEALIQSEQRYRRIFETTGTAMVLVDERRIIVLVNREFESISGYSRQEVEGIMTWTAFVSDKDRDAMVDLHRQRLQGITELPSQFEFAFVPRHGGLRSILITVDLVPGTTQCVASLIDITERKEAADLLAQRSRELEALVRSLDDVVFEVDENGRCLNMWTADSHLGKSQSEQIGHAILDTMGGTGQQAIESIRRVLVTGQREIVEYPMTLGDEIRWFSAVVNRVDTGSAVRQTASVRVRDVTSRKNAEIRLRQLEEQYRTLVENAQDVIFTLLPDGTITSVNPSFTSLTGWRPEEWVGRGFTDLLRTEDREHTLGLLRAALDGGMSKSRECHLATQSGRRAVVEVQWTRQITHGTAVSLLGIARDITGRRDIEDQIRLLRGEKQVLVQEVHHRVGNNLQVISSLLSMEMSRPRAVSGMEIFRHMQDRLKSMGAVYSAMTRSDRISQVDFDKSIRELANHLRVSYGASNVDMEILLGGTRLPLDIAFPLVLILCELLSHALRHAFPNGSPGKITIGFQHLTVHRSALSISHDGVGFHEVAGVETETAAIGLKLVDLLVGQIGGSLTTELNRGTTHTIVFPRDQGAAPQAPGDGREGEGS